MMHEAATGASIGWIAALEEEFGSVIVGQRPLLRPHRKRPCCGYQSNPLNEIAPSHLPARGYQQTDYIRY